MLLIHARTTRVRREKCESEPAPLPRAVAKGVDLKTGAGEPFIDLYWKGAGLMRAFARLGAATR